MNKILSILAVILLAFIQGVIAAAKHLETGLPEIQDDEGGNNEEENTGTAAASASAEPARRGRKPRAAAAAATTTAEPEPEPEPEPAASELTADKLRDLATPLVQQGRGAEVKALTKKFGADSIGQLDPKHYKAVASGIEALLL